MSSLNPEPAPHLNLTGQLSITPFRGEILAFDCDVANLQTRLWVVFAEQARQRADRFLCDNALSKGPVITEQSLAIPWSMPIPLASTVNAYEPEERH